MPIAAKAAPFLLLILLVVLAAPAVADPPAHAPAHGWRQKHDPYYIGYTGRQWPRDYGILSGKCNREAVATVLGGVVGGVIASRVSEPENRTVRNDHRSRSGCVNRQQDRSQARRSGSQLLRSCT